MSVPSRLILASSSPRRRQLLSQAGYRFEVHTPHPDAEEQAQRPTDPAELVAELARVKAADVVQQLGPQPHTWILAADTVAECQGEILGKPANRDDAQRILTTLSGQPHQVLSGVCLWQAGAAEACQTLVVSSTLQMQRLSPTWLDSYLNSGAWEGKAGAFGYQDDLGVVQITSGTESNVVGLPMPEVTEILRDYAGIQPAR